VLRGPGKHLIKWARCWRARPRQLNLAPLPEPPSLRYIWSRSRTATISAADTERSESLGFSGGVLPDLRGSCRLVKGLTGGSTLAASVRTCGPRNVDLLDCLEGDLQRQEACGIARFQELLEKVQAGGAR
jgi:hypothetical protein